MNTVVRLGTYWLFQALNTLTGLGLLLAPKAFHESMFENPDAAYVLLGFSETALDMLHNVLRGQGAALLAVSIFLFVLGRRDRRSYLLIFLVCGLSLVAHAFTLRHHLNSEPVRRAVGDFGPLYGMMAVNTLVALGGIRTYARGKRHAEA